MLGLQNLKLDKTSLKEIPEEMGKLLKLVSKYLVHMYYNIAI